MFCQIKGQVSKGTVQGAVKVLASFSSRSFYEDTEMTIRLNPFTTEVRFCVLNAMAFSTQKRSSVVKGLNLICFL